MCRAIHFTRMLAPVLGVFLSASAVAQSQGVVTPCTIAGANLPDSVSRAALDASGVTLLSSDLSVRRLLRGDDANGCSYSQDASLGDSGVETAPLSGASTSAKLSLDSQGRVYVANGVGALARYSDEGWVTLCDRFESTGYTVEPTGEYAYEPIRRLGQRNTSVARYALGADCAAETFLDDSLVDSYRDIFFLSTGNIALTGTHNARETQRGSMTVRVGGLVFLTVSPTGEEQRRVVTDELVPTELVEREDGFVFYDRHERAFHLVDATGTVSPLVTVDALLPAGVVPDVVKFRDGHHAILIAREPFAIYDWAF